ncbi:hypothetical protein PVAP13_2KG541700 [Panicum virgatum]|uniref:Uncharacterized protein n=1 Tax=Panicum virgatum TaxID=38727 RepID=A0A8T0WQK2_PANVG|nr:hypothetical protein PVAP13_2KG541700 [Panicum virgatum]
MATGPDLSSSSGAAAAAVPDAAAKKDRHIVSWSAEEDNVLRAQIAQHGTDNWTIIAAQFKDKTARQCRRRWYNYLNSECKKGGWSREEDMLLCEAQKLLGNRWTEIAKVVSGRTDNAVKNRFSTLCKRRAKDDEPFQENGTPCSNTNAKRVLTKTGCVTPGTAGSSLPMKQKSSDLKENIVPNMRLFGQEKGTQQDARQPLATISSNNQQNPNTVKSQNLIAPTIKTLLGPEQHCVKQEGNFMKKDDPKVAILLQQADLLCSLATKINHEDTSQSMDEAWQQLQHHLVKTEDNGMSENSGSGIASLLEELDDLIVDPYESKEEDEEKSREQNERQTDVGNEQCSGPSQASMEVTSNMAPDEMIEDHTVDNCKEDNNLCRNVLSGSMEPSPGAEKAAYPNLSEVAEERKLQCMQSISTVPTNCQTKECGETSVPENLNEVAEDSRHQCVEFTSPAHTVATFQPYADDMPTPKFTASERNFLLSVLELTSPGSRPETSQQPSCKRALLNSL